MITSTENDHSLSQPIPWTISNKYYDANVQFRIEIGLPEDYIGGLSDQGDIQGPPAVIYAFTNGPVCIADLTVEVLA